MLLKGTLLCKMPAYYASIICWHILLIRCWVATCGFLPSFFLNIPFIHVTRPQIFFWDHSIIFQPQNFNFNFQIFTLRNMWAEIEKCGQNQPNLEMSDSVLVFVREVIWHQAGGYNWNIMPQILSFLTHVTALLHFYYNFLTLQNQRHLLVLFLCMNFNTTRWSCHRQRHALNSAKHIFGKIFLIIQVFICEIIQQ